MVDLSFSKFQIKQKEEKNVRNNLKSRANPSCIICSIQGVSKAKNGWESASHHYFYHSLPYDTLIYVNWLHYSLWPRLALKIKFGIE